MVPDTAVAGDGDDSGAVAADDNGVAAARSLVMGCGSIRRTRLPHDINR